MQDMVGTSDYCSHGLLFVALYGFWYSCFNDVMKIVLLFVYLSINFLYLQIAANCITTPLVRTPSYNSITNLTYYTIY
jgi:hypothetical protein